MSTEDADFWKPLPLTPHVPRLDSFIIHLVNLDPSPVFGFGAVEKWHCISLSLSPSLASHTHIKK